MPTIGDGKASSGAGTAGAASGGGAGVVGAGMGAAAIAGAAACRAAGAATIGGPDFTIRTLPSPSVISSSAMFDSATRSMRVLSFLRSMGSPVELTNEEGEGGGVSLRAEPTDHGLRQV